MRKTNKPKHMKTAEEIFIKSAEKNMVQFEISGFKRTYPHLFKTITVAMEEYAAIKCGEFSANKEIREQKVESE